MEPVGTVPSARRPLRCRTDHVDSRAEARQVPSTIAQRAQPVKGAQIECAPADGSIAAASIEDNVAVQQTSRNARRLVVEDLRVRLDLSHIGVGDGTEATRLAGVLGALFGDVQVTSASG